VARIRRGKLALKEGWTTLNAIVDSAMETMSPTIRKSGHALHVKRLDEDVAIHADHDRLSQVFSNLLSNAAKYSEPGTDIEVAAIRDGKRVEIAIVDHGIGLTPEQQNWIFELFAQVDTTVSRARGGLGIGLTLARHIVEMHGGQLSVTSKGIGHGSRFNVRLPCEQLRATQAVTAGPAVVPMPCRALIIDDNADSADSLAMLLQVLGHEARSIYDPRAALAAVDAFEPDVVFLDIGMPGMSGYEVAGQLRTRVDARPLMLIALTGWGQPEDRRRTGEAGFDHHLVKPTDAETIQRICATLPVRLRDTN
jgi:CheY-like chemotaxis protein